jgi:hypothetical protein
MDSNFDYSNYKLQICKFVYQEHQYRGTLGYDLLSQSLHYSISATDVQQLCHDIATETNILDTHGHSVGMTPKGKQIMDNTPHPTSYGQLLDASKMKFETSKTSKNTDTTWFHKWIYPIVVGLGLLIVGAIFLV